MELWPAIDLRGGNCVRLLQGDYAKETVFGHDPVAMVSRFLAGGARRLHIVDLDGAKAGAAVQADLVRRMAAAAGIPCQIGGGIRTVETAEAYLGAGLARVILGSVASPLVAVDVARRHAGLPLAGIVYTDIATDGTMAGPNLHGLGEMLAVATAPVIASGGIATLDDVRRVREIGCAGCIVGRALYDNAFTLPDAIVAAADA